jgi:hypothetical protein
MADDFGTKFLGLDIKNIVAGISGGLSIAYAMRKPKPWELVSGMVVGGLTANYVGPSVSEWTGLPILMAAFFVGVAAKWICLRLLAAIECWIPSKEQ